MSSTADGDQPFELLHGERRVLIDLISAEVQKLDGTHEQRDLRLAFIEHRYALELVAWRVRRNRFRRLFIAATVGTAALGATSSGLVAATHGSGSTAVEVVLVIIGVAIAVLSAVNSTLNPGQITRDYKDDEFELRRLGWAYLDSLADEGTDPLAAFNQFRVAASEILDRQHGGWAGSAPSRIAKD